MSSVNIHQMQVSILVLKLLGMWSAVPCPRSEDKVSHSEDPTLTFLTSFRSVEPLLKDVLFKTGSSFGFYLLVFTSTCLEIK